MEHPQLHPFLLSWNVHFGIMPHTHTHTHTQPTNPECNYLLIMCGQHVYAKMSIAMRGGDGKKN